MTTSPKTFSDDAIRLFVELFLECVLQNVSVCGAGYMHKVGQYLVRGETPNGFAELCVLCNLSKPLPQKVNNTLVERLMEYEVNTCRSVDELRSASESARKFFLECEEKTKAAIEKSERIKRYIRALD